MEIEAIFNASDELRAQRKMMNSMLFAIPAMLRLLYATGLRIGEAVALQNKDVNLTDNFLVIRDSKNGKQRMIPLSESLSAVCKDYVHHRDSLPLLKSKDNYFKGIIDELAVFKGVKRNFDLNIRPLEKSSSGSEAVYKPSEPKIEKPDPMVAASWEV